MSNDIYIYIYIYIYIHKHKDDRTHPHFQKISEVHPIADVFIASIS